MNATHREARAALADIVRRHGIELARDARRCEALLNDNVPGLRRETHLLVSAVKEGVAANLAFPPAGLSPASLVNQGVERLTDALAIQPDAARWAVESWALALGHQPPAQVETVSAPAQDRKSESARPAPGPGPPPPPKAPGPDRSRPQASAAASPPSSAPSSAPSNSRVSGPASVPVPVSAPADAGAQSGPPSDSGATALGALIWVVSFAPIYAGIDHVSKAIGLAKILGTPGTVVITVVVWVMLAALIPSEPVAAASPAPAPPDTSVQSGPADSPAAPPEPWPASAPAQVDETPLGALVEQAFAACLNHLICIAIIIALRSQLSLNTIQTGKFLTMDQVGGVVIGYVVWLVIAWLYRRFVASK